MLLGLSSLAQAPQTAPELVVQTGTGAPQSPVDYSPDGRWIATAYAEAVTIWEASSGHLWGSLVAHSASIRTISFSPDSRWVASGSDDNSVIVWDIASRRVIRRVTTANESVGAVVFSPDGRQLVAGTGRIGLMNRVNGVLTEVVEDCSPYMWDTATWVPSRLTPPHHGAVQAVQFSPDGKYLSTGGGHDGAIVLWETATRRQVRRWEAGRVMSLSFSPSGQRLAAIVEDGIRIWDSGGGAPRTLSRPGKPGPGDVRFSPDGRWLAATDSSGQVRLWDSTTYQTTVSLRGFPGIAFSRDSLHLLVQQVDRTAILEVASRGEVASLGGGADAAGFFAASPDGRWLATAGIFRKGLKLWETASGRQALTLGPDSSISAGVFSPDRRTLAAGTSQGDIIFWRLPDGAEVRRVQRDGRVAAMAFSPDGRWLASANNVAKRPGGPSLIWIWETATGREAHDLQGHTGPVGALAFAPDGKSLASGGGFNGDQTDGTIRIWDWQTSRESRRLPGHSRGVVSLAFSPDSRKLVSASGDESDAVDSTERIWDTATGGQLWARSRPGGGVAAVAFSPDGRWIVGGGRDGSIQFSDSSGQLVKVIRAHNGPVGSVAFTSGGRLLLSSSYFDSSRIWDAATASLLAVLATRKDSTDWLVASPNGLFDGSSQGVQDLAVWRIGLRTYSPDRFFTDYYAPGLLMRLFAGERPEPPRHVAVLQPVPDVHITDPRNGAEFRHSPISVRVEAADTGGGLRQVRLYNNGKLVAQRDTGTDRKPVFTFTVELVAGSNQLSATAINAERTESPAAMVEAVFTPLAPSGKPVLWVVAVGINRCEDSRYTLRYARPDAEAIAGFFQNHRSERLFSDARVVRRVDRDATHAGIQQALSQVAGQARPEDVVLIYLAGHGTVLGEQFYFLSEEMRSEMGADDETAVRRYGMPASEIGDALRAAKAQKHILVIDACQAGGALPQIAKLMLTRGLRESEQMDRATQMLARAAGTDLIAAATEQQYAVEVPELGHGLLTSALLTGLGEKGRPEAASADGTVTILGLLQYVNRVVPEWTERYHAGNKQYPVSNTNGMDFPLWAK
jgi:WD40 repeat protein